MTPSQLCIVLTLVCVSQADRYHTSHPRRPAVREVDWWQLGQAELRRARNVTANTNVAKNVILFLGDGLGVSTVTAARYHLHQTRGGNLEDAHLAWERMPHVALSKTYTSNAQTPDSGATATAFLSGEKAQIWTVGVKQEVDRHDCLGTAGNEAISILEYSIDEDKWTGVVTNTRITHATPAASYAHSASRSWEASVPSSIPGYEQCEDIATQLVDGERNRQIRVVLGGGSRNFLPSSEGGDRTDSRNLLDEWEEYRRDDGLEDDQFAMVRNKEDFDAIDAETIEYVFGVMASSHLDYEIDRVSNAPPTQPSLSEMTQKAINILSRRDEGYFLLVEGGRIDHAHHSNRAIRSLNETIAFSDAVQTAMDMTDEEDTLIVVSADHSHVFTIAGYPTIDNNILGLVDNSVGDDDKPYLTLGYTNGPGYDSHRRDGSDEVPRQDLTDQDISSPTFRFDAQLPLSSETHGGEDVAIYARGPMSHLFHGTHEQSYIAHVMMYASCVGPNQDHCETNRRR